MKAVIDRFEGDCAVILFGDEERQVYILKKYLPEGAGEGSLLEVSFELDPEGGNKQEEKVKKLLEKLKNKNS
jgi:hypothetical protein